MVMIARTRYHQGRVAYPQPEQLADARSRMDFVVEPQAPSHDLDCSHLVVLATHARTAAQARQHDRREQQRFFDRVGYTAGFRVLTHETKTDQDSRGVWIRHEIVYVIESRPAPKSGYVRLKLRQSASDSTTLAQSSPAPTDDPERLQRLINMMGL